MRHRRNRASAAVLALLLGAQTYLAGQAGVGPVTPKRPATLDTYEKELGQQMRGDSAGKLWDRSDESKRMEYFVKTQELSREILQGAGVGPVKPKPTPVVDPPSAPPSTTDPSPKPVPVSGPTPPPPPRPPTRRQFVRAIDDLHGAIAKAKKANSSYQLSPETANDLRWLIDGLASDSR